MRHSTFDFLTKPFDGKRLCTTVRNAAKHQQLASLVDTYRANYDHTGFGGFIGSSLSMQAVCHLGKVLHRVKQRSLLLVKAWHRKEVCAETLHKISPRRDQPLVVLDCAAIPRDLIESEIFGHVKDAALQVPGDGRVRRLALMVARYSGWEICKWNWICSPNYYALFRRTFQRVGGSKLKRRCPVCVCD